jgi:lipoprotein-releasing system permease protein
MPFWFYLGLRYLKSKRKEAFISVITIISMVGVMVGVMALIVVLSVMNGFRSDLMSKILGVNSHILVLSYDGAFPGYRKISHEISHIKEVIGTSPFIYTQVMVNHAGSVSGAILKGIDTRTAFMVMDIKRMIKHGNISSLDDTTSQVPRVIIGTELANQIGAKPGSIIKIVSPYGKLTPVGRVPNSRNYLVSALFDSGMYEFDSSMLFMSLKEAQDFLGMGDRVSGIEVKVDDIENTREIGQKIRDQLGYPFWTKDWKEMNRNLVAALKLEKTTMFVILTMIVLVGALNIINTLVMVVMEKKRDIAILRAMGALPRQIMAIFITQGLVVGILGTIFGFGAGLGLCNLLAKYKFIKLPPDIYYISSLPVKVQYTDVIFVAVCAVLISFLATIYPAWHASKMDPVEALRYE